MDVFDSGFGNLSFPILPFGGDIFSRLWNVPLNRELCRPCVIAGPEEPVEEAELEVCRKVAPSTVFLRPPGNAMPLWNSSTSNLASLEMAFPFNLSLASIAPAKDMNRAIADA